MYYIDGAVKNVFPMNFCIADEKKEEEILGIKNKLNTLLAEHCDQPLEVVEKDTDRDNFMSSEQALEYGLIDSILSKR